MGRLVEALEAGDEFFGQGLAGLGPEEAAGDAAVFFDGEGEGEEGFDVALDVGGGVGFLVLVVGRGAEAEEVGGFVVLFSLVICFVFVFVEDPGVVGAEVYADLAILLEAGGVELRAEADDADGAWLELPEGVEAGGGVEFVRIFGGIVGAAGAGVGRPEVPGHLELVGDVFVELLGGFGDGVFDDGGGGVLVVFGARIGDVEALVDGGFGEGERVGRGGLNAFAGGGAAELGELAHDAGEGGGQSVEAEVGEPETEVELVGHLVIVSSWAGGVRRRGRVEWQGRYGLKPQVSPLRRRVFATPSVERTQLGG